MHASGNPSEDAPARVEHDADVAMLQRGTDGPWSYGAVLLVFDLFSGAWSLAPWIWGALSAGMLAMVAWRLRIAASDPPRDAAGGARWRLRYGVGSVAMAAVYSACLALDIGLQGLGPLQALLLTALTAFVGGGVYALAPRLAFARANTWVLIAPALAAVVLSTSPWRVFFGPLLVVYLAHAMTLARKLHEEFWRGVRATEALAERTRELDRSQEQLRRLVANIPDAVLVVQSERVAFVNDVGCRLLGRGRDAVVGQRLSDLVAPSDAEALRGYLSGTGAGSEPHELRFVREDGTPVTWEVLPSQPFELAGETASLFVARDVTERNRMRDRLTLTERLVTVGTLAAGMAHEINNPLTYVLLNLDGIAEGLREGTPREELAELAREATEGAGRVNAIVAELREFEPNRPITEDADIHEVLRRALRIAQGELRHRAQVELQEGPVGRVAGDRGRLGQVFVNLLVNAAQSIDEGQADGHRIVLRTEPGPDGAVVVTIADTGRGIPPEVLPRIFDPFFSTKGVGRGMGLGLSVCHAVIRALGGDIEVASEVGRGTTVTVRLRPSTVAPRPADAKAKAPGDAAPCRVLIVDDEPSVSRSMARVLRGVAEATCTESAAGALELLEDEPRFDLVLCDLMMPAMTGMDLYERLKSERPEAAARMVFMTGGVFTDRAREFLAQTPARVVDKPVSPAKLRELVAAVRAR